MRHSEANKDKTLRDSREQWSPVEIQQCLDPDVQKSYLFFQQKSNRWDLRNEQEKSAQLTGGLWRNKDLSFVAVPLL